MKAERELYVLALNSGSSSLKFGLYRVQSSLTRRLITGEAESIGEDAAVFHAEDPAGASLLRESAPLPSQKDAVIRIARLLTDTKVPAPQSIGHRIVHGGPQLKHHCVIDDSVLDKLNAAVAFAPLHMPPALSVIRFSRTHFPGLPQIACVDTSFTHACRASRACCRFPTGCERKASSATGFMASPANRLCVNWEARCRETYSLLISAMAPASRP